MPALRMKRAFDDDGFDNEFNTKTVKSMKISHFHDLISEVAASPNLDADSTANFDASESQLHVVNYVDKEFTDESVDSSVQNFCDIDHDASWASNQYCSLLEIYSPDDDFPLLFGNPTDLLPIYTGLCDEFGSIDALINMSSRCGVFPLIESATEASIDNKPYSSEVDLCDSNSEVLEWLNPHLSEDYVPDLVDFAELNSNAAPASKEQGSQKVTLVLDLDETLVHSTMEHCDDADFSFPVFYDTKEHMVYVKKRPHVQKFLQKMAEMFEVMIFTASQSVYADQLLDILDPDKKLFSKRFFRESCVFTDSGYTKDLIVVGVDLAKVAIIDNTPQVFQLQVNNGIPIESWYNDPSDEALLQLIPFLETLAVVDDVRPVIAKKFGNGTVSC